MTDTFVEAVRPITETVAGYIEATIAAREAAGGMALADGNSFSPRPPGSVHEPPVGSRREGA